MSRVLGWVAALETRDTVLLMTLLCATLYTVEFWYLTGFLMLVGGAGLLFRGIRHSPWLWITLLVGLVTFLAFNWYSIGNHLFLTAQWMFGIALVFWARDKDAALARTARLLVGAVFALAAVWKWISPDFADGSFFSFFFLHDFRMGPVSTLFSSLQLSDIRANAEAVRELAKHPTEAVLYLKSDPAILLLSRYLALGAGVLETLVAVLFLLPPRGKLFRLADSRDAALLAFVGTTYLIAPVSVFGVLLCTMGFAQARSDWAKSGYLLMFFVVQVLGWRLQLVSVI